MEGLYFFWLAWMGWIWATFFLEKQNPFRIKIAGWLMVIIVSASFKLNIGYYEVNFSAFIITMLLFIETRGKKTGAFLYLFLSSFILMLAYTSFMLFELFDPVWVFIDRKILIAAGSLYLTLLLHKTNHGRILSLIAGFLQGEIVFATILGKMEFPYLISSFAFLDSLLLSLAVLLAWSGLESIIVTASSSPIIHTEGEEQNTS